MDTSRLFGGAVLVSLSSLVTACAGTIETTAPEESTPRTDEMEQAVPPAKDQKYPGKGFIVHEWGTDTIVVGSDGSLQRGLHHEEEDLPEFVYDRIKAATLSGSSVEVKMETPVTYFYSDAPITVSASVGFPNGILTQWYPTARSFYPPLAAAGSVNGLTEIGDPALDLDFPFSTEACREKWSVVQNGLLDWGTIEVQDRDATATLVDAPLDKYTWSYAREVDSNLLIQTGGQGQAKDLQTEKFLFYRGLGNFDLPVRVQSNPGGIVTAKNVGNDAVGTVFVLNVGEKQAAFGVVNDGLDGGESLALQAPKLEDGMAVDSFVEALGESVTEALDAQGLYHDEAVAMVNTWKRQWFRTPGIRVLYLAPQAWTDASIPLALQPAPEQLVRVMMIRVEVITPELEAVDVEQAKLLGDAKGESLGKAHFTSLGRFAEPRLRRALSLLGDPEYGAATLGEIAAAKTAVSAGE